MTRGDQQVEVTLLPVSGDQKVLKARIPDELLDKPIRRIFPLWLLQRTLRLKQIVLVSPSLWDDPREDPVANCAMTRLANPDAGLPFRQTFLERYLAPAWAQSWSFNPGSDTLLRAYSRVHLDDLEGRNREPGGEGVSVTSTPRRLMVAMQQWAKEATHLHFVIGRTLYDTDEAILNWIGSIVGGEHGPRYFQSVQGRADSLLWKREYFRHEDEIRLICIRRDGADDADRLKQFQFEPNSVFTSVSFDPRLREFERREREAVVRGLGFEGDIVEDPAYHNVLFDIQMTNDWLDPA